MRVVSRNLRVGAGEIDLVVLDESERVVVEVRTVSRSFHPLDAIDPDKRRQVQKLGAMVGAVRRDVVGIGLFSGFVVVHWARDAF